MENVLIILLLAVIVCAAAWYLYRQKKRGKRCIGCPDGCCCSCKGSCGSQDKTY